MIGRAVEDVRAVVVVRTVLVVSTVVELEEWKNCYINVKSVANFDR